jgi:hypothetical protein
MVTVDCPGHASLIKTIIGGYSTSCFSLLLKEYFVTNCNLNNYIGAQIIDMMLLVIDITKVLFYIYVNDSSICSEINFSKGNANTNS